MSVGKKYIQLLGPSVYIELVGWNARPPDKFHSAQVSDRPDSVFALHSSRHFEGNEGNGLRHYETISLSEAEAAHRDGGITEEEPLARIRQERKEARINCCLARQVTRRNSDSDVNGVGGVVPKRIGPWA